MPGDARRTSFFKQHIGHIFTAAVAIAAIGWMMDTHLDYTTDDNKGNDNPGGYLTYGLRKANDDIGNATTKLGETSDRITATIEGREVPQKEPEVPPYARQRTIRDFKVILCIPRNLVEQEGWENPAPGSKMESFRNMIRDFVLANGELGTEYLIREDAFANFNPARKNNPGSSIAQVEARYGCPPSNYSATVLVPAR